MNRNKLDIINIKNRFWIFFVSIFIFFGLFIFTFIIYFLVRTNENTFGFIVAFIVFILEIHILIIMFSKLRYVKDGQLVFDQNGIHCSKSSDNFNYGWNEINDLKFYYRGDRFWRLKIGSFIINKGNRRYHNLHWFGKKGYDKRIIDRIDINDKIRYVKIRNEKEYNTFQNLISLAKEKDCPVKEMETDFTIKIFGNIMNI